MTELLAIDLGGTTIKCAIVAGEQHIEKVGSFKTPINDQAALLSQLTAIIESVKDRIAGISFAAPGRIDSTTGRIYEPGAILCLENFELGAYFQELTGLPVAVENDANCAALAESRAGSAQGVSNVVFIVPGTGLGGAVLYEGKLLKTAHFYSGELGYMVMNQTPHETWETANGAVVKTVAKISHDHPEYSDYSGATLFDLYQQDPVVTPYLDHFFMLMASAIFTLQMTFDPDLFVIAGGISARDDLIPNVQTKLQQLIKTYEIPFAPQLAKARFGNDANLIGAYYNLVETVG